MNWCTKNSTSPCDTNQAANVHRHGLRLRKGSGNTNVCRLAHRSHVRTRRVGIVPENESTVLNYFLKPIILPTTPLGWRNGFKASKYGIVNFFICVAIFISEVGAGAQFKPGD